MIMLLPAAADLQPEQTMEGETLDRTKEASTALFIFKSISSAQPGADYLLQSEVWRDQVRMTELVNSRNGETEVLNQLYIMDGKKREAVSINFQWVILVPR